MNCGEEQRLRLRELEEGHPQRRLSRQVERLAGAVAQRAAQLALATRGREPAQIDDGEIRNLRRPHHLPGLSIDRDERGPENLVTAHDLQQAAEQGRNVETSGVAVFVADVVRRTLGKDLLEEPDALLLE